MSKSLRLFSCFESDDSRMSKSLRLFSCFESDDSRMSKSLRLFSCFESDDSRMSKSLRLFSCFESDDSQHTKTIKYPIVVINGDRMPFCTSCGKEVEPGKKFCEYCGAPVEQTPAAPPAYVAPVPPVVSPPPQSAPPSPAGKSGHGMVIAGIVVLLVIIAGVYFIGLPLISGTQATGQTQKQQTVVQTPIPTQPPVQYNPVYTSPPFPADTPSASHTYEEKYTETYKQVYTINHEFNGQKAIFTQELTSPPLYIKFNITPQTEVREKVNDVGDMITTSYISPNSWFKVVVYDAGNGGLIEQQGFQKGFGSETRQEFMIRAPGSYRVEMSGNAVVADVRILTGK